MSDTSVLFLCLGNICRSPLAEGVFRAELDRSGVSDAVRVDSAGTYAGHAGESPDRRSVEVGLANGVDIRSQRARKLRLQDFSDFDWIVAMDRDNRRDAEARQPKEARARVVAFMDFVPNAPGPDVPDPYYGGPSGFRDVYELLASGMPALLGAVREAAAGE